MVSRSLFVMVCCGAVVIGAADGHSCISRRSVALFDIGQGGLGRVEPAVATVSGPIVGSVARVFRGSQGLPVRSQSQLSHFRVVDFTLLMLRGLAVTVRGPLMLKRCRSMAFRSSVLSGHALSVSVCLPRRCSA